MSSLTPIIVAFAIHTGVANGSSANPCFVMIDNQSCCFSEDNLASSSNVMALRAWVSS